MCRPGTRLYSCSLSNRPEFVTTDQEDLSMEQRKSAFEHYERGRVLKQSQMFDQALQEFQQAAADPQYAINAHVQMALCFKANGRHEEAAATFRHILNIGTFSSKEKAHILYLLGQTLEALGRYAEALEAYGWARNDDPDFHDVTQRIKHLIAGGRGPLPRRQSVHQSLGNIFKIGGQLTPQVFSLLGQAWDSVAQYADRLTAQPTGRRQSLNFGDVGHLNGHGEAASTRCSPPVSRERRRDTRQHVRVAVRLPGHFSSKARKVDGEGELRDLSPGGCRVTSSVVVPVGAELECCIFPQDALNPFTIEAAMVRWSRPQEFGLAFTKMRPGVQRQIAQLCRARTLVR
jgi:tetratricopeptide (TPR) repeat protein